MFAVTMINMIGYKKYNDLILGGLIMSILNKLPIGGGDPIPLLIM